MHNNELSYEEKLEDPRWKEVRTRILHRDKHTCKLCGAKELLNVHHRYYIFQNEPWEYCDNALITLCQSCHKMVHDILPSIIYTQKGEILKPMNFTPCIRCHGFGYLSQYNHVENGICFRCRGQKYEELITMSFGSVDDYIDNDCKYLHKKYTVYDSIESIDEDEAETRFQKAKSLQLKGHLKGAKSYYYRLAKLGYGKAQNNLGLLLEEEGELTAATRWFLYAAMQGIEQAKSNIFPLLMKNENTKSVANDWSNLMSDDKDFQCKKEFLNISTFFDEKVEEKEKPSIMSVLLSMNKLIEFAKEGHEPSMHLLNKYKIETVFDEIMTKLTNGGFEEEKE